MKARLPQGYGKNNMSGMIKKAQKMQEDIEKLQEDIYKREYSVNVGGGAVEVVVNGKKELLNINIKDEVIDKEEKDMLQDLIISAVNEALRKAETEMDEEMSKVTGGMNIPGLF